MTVTKTHPFFVLPGTSSNGKAELRRTGELKVGDRLVNADGRQVFVKSIGKRKSAKDLGINKMFDLEVEGVHNYFVGTQMPVLVHNK